MQTILSIPGVRELQRVRAAEEQYRQRMMLACENGETNYPDPPSGPTSAELEAQYPQAGWLLWVLEDLLSQDPYLAAKAKARFQTYCKENHNYN